MRSSLGAWASLFVALAQAGCTFYTGCPTGAQGSQPGNGDGGGNNGGGNNGGAMTGGPPTPLAQGEWVNTTSNLAGMESECGNLSYGASKPDEDLLLVTVATQGLWGSRDGGASWEKLGSDSDNEPIINRGSYILFDPEVSDQFWQTGIYNGGGLYRTTDDGKTFTALGPGHTDFVTVDFTDPDRQTLLVSGHERVHEILMSTNGGTDWTRVGDNLPEEAGVCSFPYIIDSRTFLLGCGTYSGTKPGIFRSEDAGQTWTKVADAGGGTAPLRASDGTIYWGSETTGGIVKSSDDGLTWSDPLGVDIVYAGLHSNPIELPDGRIAALSKQCVIVSDDEATTWKCVSPALPYDPGSFFYSEARHAFYILRTTCDAVAEDGVMRFDFELENR